MAGDLNARPNFKPIDGGGQQVNIGASANRSTALAKGKLHHISADVDCWIVAGGATVDAVAGEDYFLRAELVISYIPTLDSEAYISVIRRTTDATDGLTICQASE